MNRKPTRSIAESAERIPAEAALRESQERLRSVVTSAPIILFALDHNGFVTLSEGKGLESLGLQPGQLVGASVFDIYQDRPDILASTRRALAGESFTEVVEFGDTVLETRWTPMRDAEGTPIGTIGVSTDISERRRAEEKLEQFRALIDQSNDAIYVIDGETGRYLDFNTQAHDILGYRADELARLAIMQVAMHIPDLPVWRRRVELVREQGGLVLETSYRRKNGTILPVEVSARMLSHEKRDYMVVAVRDLTDRKRTEALLQANRLAAEHFLDQLVTLQEVTNQLSKVHSFDDLCSRAVELGRTRLGFERSGIWFADTDLLTLSGSFGIDESGQLRDERDRRIPISTSGQTWEALQRHDLVVRREDVPLFNNNHEQVGQGTNVTAALWDGDRIIGFISIDNLLSQQPITEQQGEILGLYASALGHLCSRKRAEEARQANEERYRALYRDNPTMYFTLDADAKVRSVNDFGANQLGYAAGELEGQSVLNVFYGPDQPAVLEQFKTCLQNPGQVFQWQFRKVRKDGSVLWVEEFARAAIDADNIPHVLVVCHDITERKRAEEALRQAEEKFRSIFENAVEGIYQTNPEGQFLNVNPAMARILGYASAAEMISSISDIPHQYYVQPGLREKFTKLIMGKGQVHGMEYQAFRKDGSKIWVSDNARAVYRATDPPLHFEGFITDITERKQAEAKIERQLRRLESLHAVDTAISSSLELHFTLSVLLEQVTRKLGIDAADVLLLDHDTYMLEFAAGSGFRTTAISRPHLGLEQDEAGRAVLDRQVVIVPNLSGHAKLLQRAETLANEGFVCYCGVPLVSKGKVKGVLEIFQRSPLEIDREWLDFLETLAGQTALAIDDAALVQDLQHSNIELTLAYDATIEGWSHALDLRDRATEGHTKRVTETTLGLARALGMSEAELVHIRRGALLHDIGKMGIPDSILSKPGPLTEKERLRMREHPRMAYEMLLPIPFLRPALDIPYCHHEKWAGNGYPQGLKGEEIPIAARIFAVVDVWDALRSDRPYRNRWPEKRVRKHLMDQAGRYFDPRIVEAFLNMYDAANSAAD